MATPLFRHARRMPGCAKGKGEVEEAEDACSRTAAPRSIPQPASGRYTGSQDLARRLPGKNPSGFVARPHLLTVAGAAPALPATAGAPDSRLSAPPEGGCGTENVIKFYIRVGVLSPPAEITGPFCQLLQITS